MGTVIVIVLAGAIAFALLLAYVRTVEWMRAARATRFAFEDRDTYLFLRLEHALGSGEQALISMRALREALRLKLAGVGYQRLLVEVSGLRIENNRAFWLLIGALGPALVNDKVRLAVVCRRWTPAAKRFRESGVLDPLPSVREGERYLRSNQAPPRVMLDPEQVEALLAPGRRGAA